MSANSVLPGEISDETAVDRLERWIATTEKSGQFTDAVDRADVSSLLAEVRRLQDSIASMLQGAGVDLEGEPEYVTARIKRACDGVIMGKTTTDDDTIAWLASAHDRKADALVSAQEALNKKDERLASPEFRAAVEHLRTELLPYVEELADDEGTFNEDIAALTLVTTFLSPDGVQ